MQSTGGDLAERRTQDVRVSCNPLVVHETFSTDGHHQRQAPPSLPLLCHSAVRQGSLPALRPHHLSLKRSSPPVLGFMDGEIPLTPLLRVLDPTSIWASGRKSHLYHDVQEPGGHLLFLSRASLQLSNGRAS